MVHVGGRFAVAACAYRLPFARRHLVQRPYGASQGTDHEGPMGGTQGTGSGGLFVAENDGDSFGKPSGQ